MVSRIVLIVLSLFFVFNHTAGQIQVNSSGNAGIGITPLSNYKLYLLGDSKFRGKIFITTGSTPTPTTFFDQSGLKMLMYLDDYPSTPAGTIGSSNQPVNEIHCMSLTEHSDIRSKNNITEFDSVLDKMMNLRPIHYDYSFPLLPDSVKKYVNVNTFKNRVGFAAQEVNEVFPRTVVYDSITDIYGIRYSSFIPYLVKAIQEQQIQVTALQDIITNQEKEIVEIKKFIGMTGDNSKKSFSSNEEITEPVLYQNSPNPFYSETRIDSYLPIEYNEAKIYIHDLNGSEVIVKDLNGTGIVSTILDGSMLTKGMYVYSLVIDDEFIDTKRMILTD